MVVIPTSGTEISTIKYIVIKPEIKRLKYRNNNVMAFKVLACPETIFIVFFIGNDVLDVSDVVNGRMERSPEFLVVPEATVAQKGETMNFECQVLGHPPPTLQWFKV